MNRFFYVVVLAFFVTAYMQSQETKAKIVHIQNEILQVEIATHGAELKSIKAIKTNKEYLWQGDTDYWNQTSPVLFPCIGKSWNNEIRYNGKSYPMKPHGFASKKDFELIKKSDKDAWFLLESDKESLTMYPFEFELYVGFILEGNQLKIQWNIKNKDTKELFFQVGGHTGFNLPDFDVSDEIFGYVELRSKTDSIQYIVKEAGRYFSKHPTQHLFEPNTDHLFPLTETFFKNDAVIFENNQAYQVILFDKNKNPLVAVDLDTPVLALWTAKHKAPFLCIEPWYGRPDTENNTNDISQRKWMQRILPKETFTACYTVKVLE